MRKNVWLAILVLAVSGLVAQADVTTAVISAADTGIRSATVTYGSDLYMYIYGNGATSYMGYVRFDLSGLSIYTVVNASLKMTISGGAPRNDSVVVDRYAPHGLNNVAGNTTQSWDEATLNRSNTGAEVNWTTGTVDMTKVTNLDGADVPGITETFVAGVGGSWARGGTFTTTGAPLVSFLQSRVDDNGFVTFIIRQDAGGGKGYGLVTREEATDLTYRPELTLTYIPGGASDPQPENGATVSRDLLTELSWTLNSGLGINRCEVYFGTEPNLLTMDKLTFAPAVESVTIDDFLNYSVPLAEDTYYWRVDCDNDSNISEPNLPGQFWSFTATSVPIVTQQTSPVYQSKSPTETAVFTATAASSSPITYTWYKSEDNANNTDPDTPVSDPQVLPGGTASTLTLSNVAVADAGYYYCKATNPGETRSNPARLSIKRQLAHWALDGNADDSSGNALNGTLFGEPNFVDGVNTTTGQAMEFDGVNDYIAEPNNTSDFSDFAPGMTISVWAKPTTAGANTHFIDFGTGAPGDNIFFARAGTTNNLQLGVSIGTAASSTVIAANAIVLNEWQMFVATVDESRNVVLYKNGLPLVTPPAVVTGTIPQMPTIITRTSNFIGESNWTADALYAGLMDDIQIWNYAKSADNIADIYSAVVGNFCRTKPDIDWDNTCKVDLGDFAIFAARWMECGMYPECP